MGLNDDELKLKNRKTHCTVKSIFRYKLAVNTIQVRYYLNL